MTRDDVLKLKAATLYILNECEAIDPLHLFKILYFADIKHLANYGRRIIADPFYALDRGPVPTGLYDAIKALKGKHLYGKNNNLNIITAALKIDNDPVLGYVIYPLESFDAEELSVSDIECLSSSIKENSNLSFCELSKKSHQLAWTEANRAKRNSKLDILLMAEEAGAPDDMIEYIREDLLLNDIIA
ncbi:MAG: Panacea domain-containing protein [Rikenellaceae bacterium]